MLRGGPADPSPVLHPALRVVGIVAAESEFPSGAAVHYDLYATTAFAAAVNHRAALLSYTLDPTISSFFGITTAQFMTGTEGATSSD
jgi:hypothetical protein